MDIDKFAKKIDAKFNLPRPINYQHLSSYQALLRFMQDAGRVVSFVVATVVSLYCLWSAMSYFGISYYSWGGIIFLSLIIIAIIVCAVDTTQVRFQYERLIQRESQGSARWATKGHLKARNMITHVSENPLPESIPLATFGSKYRLTLPIELLAEHLVFFGPPGSGKSASFFINLARAFSHVGGMIALDVKGEIYDYSANYFRNVYRFDLLTPEFSDRFDLLSICRGDAKKAGQVASYIIGFDPNSPPRGDNIFFPKAATLMLTCLILHLCELLEHPTPSDIFDFLSDYPCEGTRTGPNGKPERYNPLADEMASSPNDDARSIWGATFSQLDNKTMSNVAVTMLADLGPFRDTKVRDVMRMPTDEEVENGCRIINFRDLRKKGTAIYVVVPEGEASRLETVIASLFAVATDILRETGDDENAKHTLIMLDEAGNVPLRNLSEGVGVGRGRKIVYALGYQNLSQPSKQYGRDTAFAILQSVGTKIFLPGLSADTAEFASKIIGKTTTLKRSSTDAVGDRFDNERLEEVQRDLMDTNELREMLRYHQCIAVINNASPIRCGFPVNAKELDTRKASPRKFTERNKLETYSENGELPWLPNTPLQQLLVEGRELMVQANNLLPSSDTTEVEQKDVEQTDTDENQLKEKENNLEIQPTDSGDVVGGNDVDDQEDEEKGGVYTMDFGDLRDVSVNGETIVVNETQNLTAKDEETTFADRDVESEELEPIFSEEDRATIAQY